uniref:Katanin p80 subunit C-terminal domain-containing protein n=1 Tax=Neogobius melanostomus TaxID=47308 RepID=A0A8C6U4V2_9GOBI
MTAAEEHSESKEGTHSLSDKTAVIEESCRMDSNTKDGHYQILDQDRSPYKVTYRNTKEMEYYKKNEDPTKKRVAASRAGPNPGRVKRVVSCKRKTHHLTVAWKKPPGTGKPHAAANKENELNCRADMEQGVFCMDPWDLPQNKQSTGRTGPEPPDYSLLSELRRDHIAMNSVLFGRNLRLKVAFTLWERNVGELLTYFLRIQDSGVFVDFLPVITKSINENTSTISIGSCVDLFPLVKKVLSNPYEEYITVGLKWIDSVLKNWWKELRESGLSGSTKAPLDKNFQIFNQHLLELWHHEPLLKSVPGPAGDLAKAIDLFILQLPW